jgi:hypothetical protein
MASIRIFTDCAVNPSLDARLRGIESAEDWAPHGHVAGTMGHYLAAGARHDGQHTIVRKRTAVSSCQRRQVRRPSLESRGHRPIALACRAMTGCAVELEGIPPGHRIQNERRGLLTLRVETRCRRAPHHRSRYDHGPQQVLVHLSERSSPGTTSSTRRARGARRMGLEAPAGDRGRLPTPAATSMKDVQMPSIEASAPPNDADESTSDAESPAALSNERTVLRSQAAYFVASPEARSLLCLAADSEGRCYDNQNSGTRGG